MLPINMEILSTVWFVWQITAWKYAGVGLWKHQQHTTTTHEYCYRWLLKQLVSTFGNHGKTGFSQ